jgi:hypothetical protein
MGGFSKTWNHMDNLYLQQISRTGAGDAWKQAPVAFESCWDMRKWKESGWDIRHIFDYALQCHASYVNNKSAPIPESTREEVERFLKRLGYRLVVRSVEHLAVAHPGGNLAVEILWENVGVAPPYRDYRVALQLRNAKRVEPRKVFLVMEDSIRGWLPGTRKTEAALKLPNSLPPGPYELAVGVVDLASKTPAVRLAIAGRDAEGWYSVSHVEISPR